MKKRKYRKARSSPALIEKKTIITVLGIFLLTFSLLLTVAIFTKTGALQSLKDYFYNLFGIGIIIVPLILILISLQILSIKVKFSKANVIIGMLGALLSLLGLL